MAELLHLAYSREISLHDLYDKADNLIEDLIDTDKDGYCEASKYEALKDIWYELGLLHDDFTAEYYKKNMDYLLRLVDSLIIRTEK